MLNHRGLRFVHLMLDECLALVHKLCFVHVDNCNFFVIYLDHKHSYYGRGLIGVAF